MGAALPTADRAKSPIYSPTTMESTVLYSCWAKLPISMGMENSNRRFHGAPSVILWAANNARMFTSIDLFSRK